jgi:GlpG protein
MIWVWILLKQIEERLSKWKICLLILLIGVISNTCQYLISGPYFLGFSGVAVGLAGFIWMRQKKAPWEGYPLQKGTILFLLFFVVAMFALELFTFGLQLFTAVKITPSIANTAHIVGGLAGMLFGRFSFFGRRAS